MKISVWSPGFRWLMMAYGVCFLGLMFFSSLGGCNHLGNVDALSARAIAFYAFLFLPLVYLFFILIGDGGEVFQGSLRGQGLPGRYAGTALILSLFAGLGVAAFALESHERVTDQGSVVYAFGNNLYLLAGLFLKPFLLWHGDMVPVSLTTFWIFVFLFSGYLLCRPFPAAVFLGGFWGGLLASFAGLSHLFAAKVNGAYFLFGEALFDIPAFFMRPLSDRAGLSPLWFTWFFYIGAGGLAGWLVSVRRPARIFLFLTFIAAFFPLSLLLSGVQHSSLSQSALTLAGQANTTEMTWNSGTGETVNPAAEGDEKIWIDPFKGAREVRWITGEKKAGLVSREFNIEALFTNSRSNRSVVSGRKV